MQLMSITRTSGRVNYGKNLCNTFVMYNKYDEEDNHDYTPNELARLSETDPSKYKEIVQSNLDEDDTIENYHRRNLEQADKLLVHQLLKR